MIFPWKEVDIQWIPIGYHTWKKTITVHFKKWNARAWKHFVFWNVVTTLALSLQPRQGLTRVRAKSKVRSHISCSQECKKLWGNEPSHSQASSYFGSWSPNRFSNFQKVITGVKTHWIEAFHISLESFWNVNVWNGLVWPIWTPKT